MIHENYCLKDRVEFDDSIFRHTDFNPYYSIICSGQTDPLIVNGKEMINLATNNYLGLSNDERIKEAYINAIKKYGISMCSTPIVGGYTELFQKIRYKLSEFIGVEDVLIYPSCYQANNGIFQTVTRKDDLVLFDRFVHSSLIQGIRSVGCKSIPFSHNNTETLEYLLKKYSHYEKIFVVTESVFSTEGAIAPFADIYKLCKKYNAVPVVDDSHGIGVIGKNGKGILSYSNIEHFEGIYTSSLGKALANNCGVVGGSRELINYLSYFCSHLVYSTAVSPAVLAGIDTTLDIVEDEYDYRAGKIFYYAEEIKNSLKANGFLTTNSAAPINSIISGTSENTFFLAKKIFQNGILTTPFVYPSVRKNDGRIRMIAGANLKESSIEKVCKLFNEIEAGEYEDVINC
ncbi:MAG: pyridoxal phosphate-dependent aminotransferase family protein [Bacteroidetes bacterium]|nr:pyridoxal phosphate-dependent aminotransferase family protein [Bacteroidota bacterium]